MCKLKRTTFVLVGFNYLFQHIIHVADIQKLLGRWSQNRLYFKNLILVTFCKNQQQIGDVTTNSLFGSILLTVCTAIVLSTVLQKENIWFKLIYHWIFFLSVQYLCNQHVSHLSALLESYMANSLALEVILLEMHSRNRNQDCKSTRNDKAQQCNSVRLLTYERRERPLGSYFLSLWCFLKRFWNWNIYCCICFWFFFPSKRDHTIFEYHCAKKWFIARQKITSTQLCILTYYVS